MSIMKKIFKKIGSLLTGEKMEGRRNNFFVEKEFQKSFIIFFLVMASLLMIASGTAFYIMLRGVMEESMYVIHPRFKGAMEIFTFNLVLFFVEVSVIFFAIIIMVVDGMMKRIAKSLMAYERISDHLARLDFRRAKNVEAKLFPRLHRQYMNLIESYSADVLLLKEKLERIQGLIELIEKTDDVPPEKKTMAISELFELNNAVKSKTAEYKFDNSF